MMYASIPFVFFISLVLLILYYLPKKAKAWWLLISSLVWYFSWNESWPVIFFNITAFNTVSLFYLKPKNQKLYGTLVFLNVLVFILLKTLPYFMKFTTPYGTSFFMLIQIGIVIDYWREKTSLESTDILPAFMSPFFFPLLMAGPIERKKSLFSEIKNIPAFKLENLIDGILIFSLGFMKKNLLVDPYANSEYISHSLSNFLLQGLLDTFMTYLLFSSYCEMGRGCAKAMGINLTNNFRPFYYSKNPSDFWQRWNISLGTWVRDYVTFPAMFRWGRKISPDIIIAGSFLIMGLWHGIGVNWLIFGLFNGAMIFLYNYSNRKGNFPLLGFFLSVCVWIGNGIFQQFNFWERITSPDFFVLPKLNGANLPLFFAVLALLFIFEFFQEKKNKNDFFLEWSLKTKTIIAIFFIAWFAYQLDLNNFYWYQEAPPVYFRI